MRKIITIKLYPTKEQEKIMFLSIKANKFAYNWGIDFMSKKDKDNFKLLDKEFNKFKKLKDNKWLLIPSQKIYTQCFRDLKKSFINFFKGNTKYPKYKNRLSKNSFYHRGDTLFIKNNRISLEKIGWIKFKDNGRLIQGYFWKGNNLQSYYQDLRIKYDNKNWYLSLSIEFPKKDICLNGDLIIGIDLGLKKYATLSNGIIFDNINKSFKVKKLENDIILLDKRISNKLNISKANVSNNCRKLIKERQLKYLKLKNIRRTFIHKITKKIVDLKPKKIVVENLRIQDLQKKNKHISKYIRNCNFSIFKETLRYKCLERGIEFMVADRYFASSKICSNCGNKKKHLSLSDRIYKCDKCGLEIDRDLNASINLKNYKDKH